MNRSDLHQELLTFTATIAINQSLSDAIDLKAHRPHRINMPSGWTAAGLSFQVSDDGTTWRNLYSTSGEVTVSSTQADVDRSIVLDMQLFFGARYLKIRSGTAASPVNQAAARSLVISAVPR